jgi:hypothetical protein
MREYVVLVLVLAVPCLVASSCSHRDGGPPPEAEKGEGRSLADLSPAECRARVERDLAALKIYRRGLSETVAFMRSQPAVFPAQKVKSVRMLEREHRATARRTWERLLDYVLALDSVAKLHRDFLKLEDKSLRRESFLVAYATFLAEYRFALEFIDRIENEPAFDKLLNEPVPELGLPEGTYARFKFRFLNVARGTEFVALNAVNLAYGGTAHPETREAAKADRAAIWKMGKGRGEQLTLLNGLNILKKAGWGAWFPVQTGVIEWMGDTKVWRRGRVLITEDQIAAMAPRVRPGDVVLQRREWYMSNIGVPGFWTHAALIIGTRAERRAFFDTPAVRAWAKERGAADGDLETLLARECPEVYKLCATGGEAGHRPRVVEAIGEGVSVTTLEHSAAADSLVVLRPRVPKVERAAAVLRALRYVGRPYDYEFDFVTDAALVCTELVYKCYEPGGGVAGIPFELAETLGRKVLPPNDIARTFDETFGTDAQRFDFVLFLDGSERGRAAVESTVEAFRTSWTRPKWHILVAGEPERP